jgi:hypothetical protein
MERSAVLIQPALAFRVAMARQLRPIMIPGARSPPPWISPPTIEAQGGYHPVPGDCLGSGDDPEKLRAK